MDVLSDILDLLKFRGSLYFATEFNAPWGIQVPPYQNVARFHLATGGDCWVNVDGGGDAVLLSAGDMIIIPHGAAHTLSDQPDTPIVSLDRALEVSGYVGEGHFIYGGDGTSRGHLVCGHFEFDDRFRHPLLDDLPDYILIRGKQAVEFSWFENAMRYLDYESGGTAMGSQAIVKRLSEILFIHAVRAWSAEGNHESGFLRAVADRHIGRGLKRFHEKPDAPWTIDQLATECGLSRSVFADRFRDLMDMTPAHYMTFWRMQRACEYLLESDLSTDAIAEKVGYQSLASFSKVFKKTIGTGPGHYRKSGARASHAAA